MSMPVIIPVADRTLAGLFLLNFAVCAVLRLKLVSDVNKFLPRAERRPYLQYWTIFQAERFDADFRKLYPHNRMIRLIASLASGMLLIIALEATRRWIAR